MSFPAAAALFAAFTAVELYAFLNPQSDTGTTAPSTQASALDGAAQVLLPLAAMVALSAAVAAIYRHLHHAAAFGAGAANRRLSELAILIILGAVGVLDFFLFPSGCAADGGGAQARVLGMAAVGALPASATATFFLGMTLIIAHIRAGGEGGGGVPAPVGLLKKMALGAAAALLTQMAMALYAATC